MHLLSVNQDTKTQKGVKYGYLTAVLYLAPGNISGKNLCPNASPGCLASCLFTAGRAAQFKPINIARVRRSKEFLADRQDFLIRLLEDIDQLDRRSAKRGLIPCVRLNGTSDVAWESIQLDLAGLNLMDLCPHIQFYDYTKSFRRAHAHAMGQLPKNYHLTFSRSETNQEQCIILAKAGANIAAVFDKVPDTCWNRPVVDGDLSDLRFLDPKGSIVGLKAKGKARKDKSGFVITTP